MLYLRGLCHQLFSIVTLAAVLLGALESVMQAQDAHYTHSVAQSVVQRARAADARARVIALRDYLRAHVTFRNAPFQNRPFLRATAGDILRFRHGYCGEVTRTFICMAAAVGVRAQRINLYGRSPHVVAEAELAPDDKVIVDCQNPPKIAGLSRLDEVMLRPEYRDYSTLNVRRLRLDGLVSRIKLEMGPLTYWTENPHALQASLWFLLAGTLVALRSGRSALRYYLRKRGWIHASDVRVLQTPVMAPSKQPEVVQ